MDFKRFRFKGRREQLPKIEAAIQKMGIDRKGMYTILKYFEINPDSENILKQQYPDV